MPYRSFSDELFNLPDYVWSDEEIHMMKEKV